MTWNISVADLLNHLLVALIQGNSRNSVWDINFEDCFDIFWRKWCGNRRERNQIWPTQFTNYFLKRYVRSSEVRSYHTVFGTRISVAQCLKISLYKVDIPEPIFSPFVQMHPIFMHGANPWECNLIFSCRQQRKDVFVGLLFFAWPLTHLTQNLFSL